MTLDEYKNILLKCGCIYFYYEGLTHRGYLQLPYDIKNVVCFYSLDGKVRLFDVFINDHNHIDTHAKPCLMTCNPIEFEKGLKNQVAYFKKCKQFLKNKEIEKMFI